ncbi:hypothetical protein TSUD_371460 [Trifolium subterraneum]|uniref:GAG-pre-integrase domain-containing protein n=1 Tax=Trifolium subterraneum TaxID=3900 RepID=A0A2Z6P8R4_TRISU|nr:hypothetical protein TSUD_371460 [Trifolium subterraneum]
MDKEGGYVTRPPLLDDSNYDIWKARMIAFLKSDDNRTWKAVLKGWVHPKVKDANGTDTNKLKPGEDWTAAEDSLALGNSKALNALFNGVDKIMFTLIKRCTVAKEAWELLKTTQEGTAKVKISRFQNLTRNFENLRMKEDESVHNFYMNVMDFANSFDDLGEKLSDEKIVRKILRSLTKKFDMKVIAMEEAQDISTMKFDELIGSLQTYESSVNERLERKNKSIAFVSNTDDEDLEIDMESTDSISEAIVLLGRQFNKKQKKRMAATWSDEEESDREGESTAAKHVTVLTGIVTSDTESCDEEVSYEELAATYKDLCLVSEEKCRELVKQKKINSQLQAERCSNLSKIDELHKKVICLTSDLNEANEEIDNLNVDIVSYENVNKYRGYNPELMYTQLKESQMSSKMLEHPKQHHGFRYKTKSHPWVCHYCGRKGHIRPFCYKLYGYPNRKPRHIVTPIQKEWKPKNKDVSSIPKIDETLNKDQVASLISHTSFRASSREDWYFDRKLNNNSLPKLDNVLLVKGLIANLISISQICDQGLKVNFTKTECLVTDDNAKEYEVKFWHQRLGHLNLKSMKKAISEEAIRGLPKLKIEEGNICGECQIGKQTKTSHQKPHHLATTRVLKLLHMDLMGPMQVESLGGKRTKIVMESSNVVINDLEEERMTDVADDAIASDLQFDAPEVVKKDEPDPNSEISNSDLSNAPPKKVPSIRIQKNHPQELIIGNLNQGITTRRMNDVVSSSCFVSKIEPNNVKEPLVENPNEETVKDSETLGLANPRCIEKLGKTGPSCSDPPTVGVGALLEAKSDSVLEHDKKNAPEEDAAHNARQPTNILTRDQIIADLKEFEKTAAPCARIEGTSSVITHVTEDDADDVGGDTEVEEEHSDASPLVCSA